MYIIIPFQITLMITYVRDILLQLLQHLLNGIFLAPVPTRGGSLPLVVLVLPWKQNQSTKETSQSIKIKKRKSVETGATILFVQNPSTDMEYEYQYAFLDFMFLCLTTVQGIHNHLIFNNYGTGTEH
jgi:hypothetical protein